MLITDLWQYLLWLLLWQKKKNAFNMLKSRNNWPFFKKHLRFIFDNSNQLFWIIRRDQVFILVWSCTSKGQCGSVKWPGKGYPPPPLSLPTLGTICTVLLPHLREEVETPQAAHNAVNFWKTFPFPTGLSRETDTTQIHRNRQWWTRRNQSHGNLLFHAQSSSSNLTHNR